MRFGLGVTGGADVCLRFTVQGLGIRGVGGRQHGGRHSYPDKGLGLGVAGALDVDDVHSKHYEERS